MRLRSRPSLIVLAALLGAAAPRTPGAPSPEAEERRLAAARIAAAATLRATETELAARAAEVEALAERQRQAELQLAQRSAALGPLLPLVERLALYPAETLLAVPVPPARALQGLGILRGMARHVQTEAAALRTEAREAASASAALTAALAQLRAAQAVQAAQAAELDAQLEAARIARQRADDAAAEQARRSAAEAARAETVRAALQAIEADRARAEARARDEVVRAERQRHEAAAAEARRRSDALARPAGPGLAAPTAAALREGGHAPVPAPVFAPVAGTVVRGWGAATDAGPAAGLTVRPPPGARVTAPCTGRVAFAGPFRAYGTLLILDCGGGFHFVLAGFERLDVPVGTSVQAAEPVGVMPGWDPRSAGPRPALYVELRRDGVPINPAPFLRAGG